MPTCEHIANAGTPVPRTPEGCEECLKRNSPWVELRLCLSCGHVGCCDSSEYKDATRHFEQTQHPVIRSFETGKEWRWCYVDRLMDG